MFFFFAQANITIYGFKYFRTAEKRNIFLNIVLELYFNDVFIYSILNV